MVFPGEKAKLSEQIDAFNNLVDEDSAGDSLAGFMKPAEQLKTVCTVKISPDILSTLPVSIKI